jgi:hypothetical protein
MRFRDAEKLHKGDEVIDKVSGESIKVICAFEEPECSTNTKKCIMIEGIKSKQGYNHWHHTTVK